MLQHIQKEVTEPVCEHHYLKSLQRLHLDDLHGDRQKADLVEAIKEVVTLIYVT